MKASKKVLALMALSFTSVCVVKAMDGGTDFASFLAEEVDVYDHFNKAQKAVVGDKDKANVIVLPLIEAMRDAFYDSTDIVDGVKAEASTSKGCEGALKIAVREVLNYRLFEVIVKKGIDADVSRDFTAFGQLLNGIRDIFKDVAIWGEVGAILKEFSGHAAAEQLRRRLHVEATQVVALRENYERLVASEDTKRKALTGVVTEASKQRDTARRVMQTLALTVSEKGATITGLEGLIAVLSGASGTAARALEGTEDFV